MLPQGYRLKKNKDFQNIYRSKKSCVGKYLVIYYKKNNLDHVRIGFTVSKKIGNAVTRNKIKRKLREICRLNLTKFVPGYDLIFVARGKIKGIEYEKIEQELQNIASKAGVLK